MPKTSATDLLNGIEIYDLKSLDVVKLDSKCNYGVYGYTRHANAKNIEFNNGVQFKHIRLNGKTTADTDSRLTYFGIANNDGLCNIVAWAKMHGHYVKTSGNHFTITTGIANKFHGLGSMQKFIIKYSSVYHVNCEVFNHDNNTFLGKYNLDGYDVVKFMQEKFDRGYYLAMVTDRPDYI